MRKLRGKRESKQVISELAETGHLKLNFTAKKLFSITTIFLACDFKNFYTFADYQLTADVLQALSSLFRIQT